MAELTTRSNNKKPYVKTKGESQFQSGPTAKAKADLKKAINSGAAKTAKKLVKPKVKEIISGGDGVASRYKVVKKILDPKTAEKKAMTFRIINDKSKTAMRARMIESRLNKKVK